MENQILDQAFNEKEQPFIDSSKIRYAGFWIRVVASLLDFLVLIPVVILNYYNILTIKSLPLELLIVLLTNIYKPLMEYKYGATVGKMAVNIKVVNYDYTNITLEQALIRYFPWLVNSVLSIASILFLFQSADFEAVDEFLEIGYATQQAPFYIYSQLYNIIFIIIVLAVAFDKRKQGLHDKLAKTYCIYKD